MVTLHKMLYRCFLVTIVGSLLVAGCGPAPTSSPSSDEAPPVPDPASALEAALGYIEQNLAGGPGPDQTWSEENVTGEGLVGSSTFRYTRPGWTATVAFPVVAPEAMVYTIYLFAEDGTFYWEGQVDAQGEVSELRVNPVEAAQLTGTTSVEILQLDLDSDSPTSGEYIVRLAIDDPDLVTRLLEALDTNLRVAPKLACIPEYTLRFQRADGSAEEFGYSCSGASFLRGSQEFWQGQDFQPPEALDAILSAHLTAALPSEINIAEAAGLAGTVRIVILETVSRAPPESPGVVKATTVERLTVDDPAMIAQLVAELDTPLPLAPRARVMVPYSLQFHREDGRTYSLGYLPASQGAPILRGDDAIWGGQDAEPPAAFDLLMQDLLLAADEAPAPVLAAFDAALAFVQKGFLDDAPEDGLAWSAKRTTPEGLLGSESYQLTADGWLVTISFPVVAPENVIYQVSMEKDATGFVWRGEVRPSGDVTELMSTH